MAASRFVLLLTLLAVTALASAVLTVVVGIRRTSERLLAMVVCGHLLTLAPVYALAVGSRLSFSSVTWGTLGADIALLAALTSPRLRAEIIAELGHAARQLGRDIRRLVAPRRYVTAGGVIVLGVVALTAWLILTCYFAPSFRAYDAPWYHEPITGFTIQEGGLQMPPLPRRLFFVEGNLRGSELMSAWLVLVTGSRALIELPSVLGLAMLWLATYRLGRVLGAERRRALGWATVVILTPGLISYAQSTYVDLHACALLTVAACFALARPVSAGHALLAVTAASLAACIKLYAVPPGVCLALVALVRVYAAKVDAPSLGFRVVAYAMAVSAAAIALVVPLRNAVVYGNPLYPISVTLPLLGRVLPGPLVNPARDFEMTPRWDELIGLIFQPLAPYHTNFSHYIEVHLPIESGPAFNYGYAMPTVGLALALVALAQVAANALRTHAAGTHTRRARTRLISVAIVLLAASSFCVAFPATRLARYFGFVLACTGAVAATALSGRTVRRAGNLVLAGAIGLQLAVLLRQDPPILYSPAEIRALAALSPSERELAPQYGAFALAPAARFRDRVLAGGTTIAFGDDVREPAPLWNSSFSNRLEYLAGDDDPTEAADARGITLLACTVGSARCTAVMQRSDAWEFVGPLYPEIISGRGLVFSRCRGACRSRPE
ncbi:MAG TPA: hypothetical protein VMW17_00610 [Candidatus Binatia bacterium]|nr:hypothetical protein [Candidatus Binatia bacterium]